MTYTTALVLSVVKPTDSVVAGALIVTLVVNGLIPTMNVADARGRTASAAERTLKQGIARWTLGELALELLYTQARPCLDVGAAAGVPKGPGRPTALYTLHCQGSCPEIAAGCKTCRQV